MIEVAATAQPAPRIEVCRICHFLWFDADELAAFAPLPAVPARAETPLPAETRETLAIAELELIKRKADHDERKVANEFWDTLARFLRGSFGA